MLQIHFLGRYSGLRLVNALQINYSNICIAWISVGIQVDMDLKGGGAKGAKKVPLGRGKGGGEAADKKGGGRGSGSAAKRKR